MGDELRDPYPVMPASGKHFGASARPSGYRLAAVLGGGTLIGLIVLTGIGFVWDQATHREGVSRNVSVGGRDVSSASKGELAEVLAEVNRRYATTEVLVADGDSDGFTTDAGTIGLQVDPMATAERVLAVGRTGSLPSRWWSWISSFRASRRSQLALSVDRVAVSRLVMQQSKKSESPPTEASIGLDKQGRFIGVSGKPGEGIDPAQLADSLQKAAERGTPIKVKARRGALSPRFTKADADVLAKRAEALIAKPLELIIETTKGTLSPATLRPLLSAVPGERSLEIRVDETEATKAAEKVFVKAGTPAIEPTFQVDQGPSIRLVSGVVGRACCGPEAGAAIAAAILQRPDGPVALTLVEKQPRLNDTQANELGVKEEVSTFATKHPCCQPRVTNIHKMADLVRGQVIPPGQSFSVNDFVGQRTTEKGFVVDRVIEDGRFAEDVGGGVSQFATTLFNAAWFAGLEFGEYQSHSLMISRYPKGREATLGFPHPDLVIKNTSPYGILIWPTYTDTEIRVTFYSTKWVAVKAAGQDTQPNGSCTVYITKRERTFRDGRVVNDATRARYRANEGQNCTDELPPEETTTTSTTLVGSPTTATTATTKPAPSTTTTTKKPATTAPTTR